MDDAKHAAMPPHTKGCAVSAIVEDFCLFVRSRDEDLKFQIREGWSESRCFVEIF
jgi:hypothetical protein